LRMLLEVKQTRRNLQVFENASNEWRASKTRLF